MNRERLEEVAKLRKERDLLERRMREIASIPIGQPPNKTRAFAASALRELEEMRKK